MNPRFLFRSALAVACLSLAQSHAANFSFQDKKGEALDILQDGKVVARYMYGYDMSSKERREETYKPYLHVFTADGSEPITKGPGGTFPHHRGIFVGWNKLTVGGKTYDRWHMKGGEQQHQKFLDQKAGADGATFTSLIEWNVEKGEPVLLEERTIKVLPATKPAYAVIDLSTKLKAVAGETVLDGDPEHSGVQFRPSMDVKTTETVYLIPKEKQEAKTDRDYPWFGGNFTIKDKRYAVLYLNHPQNPKDAPVSAYRDYGRFGAFFKDTIPAGGERVICARFIISEGDLPDAATAQKLYNEYAGTSDPAPKASLNKVKPSKPAVPKKVAEPKGPAAVPAS